MMNSTQLSYFTLSAYFDTGPFKSACFLTVLLLYVCIIGANLLLIVVICMNRALHEPMYLFLCSLFVNELYGSSGLFPFILLQMLSDSHTVSAPLCFLQIFVIYSYGGIEFLNLAVMSYDRYLAICFPLQYHEHMTLNKVSFLVTGIWCPPILVNIVVIPLIVSLQLCGNVINKVYCDNFSIVKLSCSDTTVYNVYGLIVSAFVVFGPMSVILYTYAKIFRVCFSGCEQSRQKAVATCTPHLASLLNFTCGATFEVLQSRFNMKTFPNTLRIFLSLYFLACPPLFNPVMYGLKLSKIRLSCKSLITKSAPH